MALGADIIRAVSRMLQVQHTQIATMTADQQAKLHGVLEEARRRLQDDLVSMKVDSFTAQHYRQALLQCRLGVAMLESDLQGGLIKGAEAAYTLANRHLIEQVQTFSQAFEGTVRSTSWRPVVALSDEVLLSRFQSSAQAYGAGLIGRMQRELAVQAAMAKPWTDVVRSLTGMDGILAQDYRGMDARQSHRQSRAEAIVRTELASAYNRGHIQNLRQANEADPGYEKTLVATFDTRTGRDSMFVHGQVRPLNKPFQDNAGREYMEPPNRTNDREVLIPTRPEWREAGFGVKTADELNAPARIEAERTRLQAMGLAKSERTAAG